MQPIVGAISAIGMSLPIAVEAGQADLGTPRQQYSAILKEYNPASGGLRKATTDLERKAAVERLARFPSKFVKLAAKHPEAPIALTALRQACEKSKAKSTTWVRTPILLWRRTSKKVTTFKTKRVPRI